MIERACRKKKEKKKRKTTPNTAPRRATIIITNDKRGQEALIQYPEASSTGERGER